MTGVSVLRESVATDLVVSSFLSEEINVNVILSNMLVNEDSQQLIFFKNLKNLTGSILREDYVLPTIFPGLREKPIVEGIFHVLCN